MPKRKSKDDYEYLTKKLRKLERKIRKKRKLSTSSSECSSFPKDKEDENMSLEENLPIDIIDVEQPNTVDDASQQLTEINDTSVLDEPSTSAAVTAAPEPTETAHELDQDIMEILGSDPTTNTKYGKDTNTDLAVRIQHYCTSGITKEVRKELSEKYLIPNNCKLIDAPQLNAEIKAALTDIVAKRDKYIENRQKQLATTLSCLTEALSHLFAAQNKDTNLIKLIMDASRNLCDCQYNDSITRRNFILSTVKKDMKEQLQNTKLSNFLFGDNLSETIKVAKAINKSGAELKASLPPPKPVQNKKFIPGSSKNWKTPFPTRKPPGTNVQKTKEPAPPPRSRPSSSYKQSQPRQSNARR